MSEKLLLEAQDLVKRFGGITAVNGFSLFLHGGELYGLIGPNGAGKTTVFNLLTGLIKPDSGHIRIKGKELTGKPAWYFAREGIVRTFQNIRLLWDFTVEENLLYSSYIHFKHGFFSGMFGSVSFRSARKRLQQSVDYVLELCDLRDYRHARAMDLPYGVQRRVEIARGLLMRPQVFLLDEPTAGLNPAEVSGILHLLKAVWQDSRLTMIVIEHNMRVIMSLAQHIIVMSEGKTIAQGPPEEIQTNPDVISVYLGERYAERLRNRR